MVESYNFTNEIYLPSIVWERSIHDLVQACNHYQLKLTDDVNQEGLALTGARFCNLR